MNAPMLIVKVVEVDINMLADLVEEHTAAAQEDFVASLMMVPPDALATVAEAVEAELNARMLQGARASCRTVH